MTGSGTLLVFNGTGQKMQLQQTTLPPLQSGEILVRNLYTTICGSDLHTFCGIRQEKTPTVLGHEIVGKIVEIDNNHSGKDHAGNSLSAGDTVTWSIFSADPTSEMSAKGMPQKSENVFKYGHAMITEEDCFHGGLAEYTILKPYTAILKIDASIPIPVAATINCAVATVAGALRLAGELKDTKVLITGMGLLGVMCAAMCRDAGAESIVAADVDASRLAQAQAFGADSGYLINIDSLPSGIDVVFDMSGSPSAMEAGIEALGIGGIAVWIGAVFHNRKIMIDAEQIIRRLITIKGLHNYNYEDFSYAVDFISRNHQKFPFEQVVGKEFTLANAHEAFEYALTHKPLRVGIRIDSSHLF